mgnify:CR=1 FL=1
MVTKDEILELNRRIDIGALITFIGAPIKNLRPHKKNNGIPVDYRINAWWRGGDNLNSTAITFDYNKQKWLITDFNHRSVVNLDLIDFLTKTMNYGFRQALDVMVFASGKENKIQNADSYQEEPQHVNPTYIDNSMLEVYNSGILHPYWLGRGYTPEIAKSFKLGYCEVNGLLKDRLTIPIMNEDMKIIGFQGRATDDNTFPKYVFGSTEQGYFAKRTLYSYRLAKLHAQSRGWIGIVEGAPSVWRAIQYDYGNFLATLSNAVTDEQLNLLLATEQENFVIFADNDASGASQHSAVKLAMQLKERGKRVWLTMPPTLGLDPADINRDSFMLCLKMAKEFGV